MLKLTPTRRPVTIFGANWCPPSILLLLVFLLGLISGLTHARSQDSHGHPLNWRERLATSSALLSNAKDSEAAKQEIVNFNIYLTALSETLSRATQRQCEYDASVISTSNGGMVGVYTPAAIRIGAPVIAKPTRCLSVLNNVRNRETGLESFERARSTVLRSYGNWSANEAMLATPVSNIRLAITTRHIPSEILSARLRITEDDAAKAAYDRFSEWKRGIGDIPIFSLPNDQDGPPFCDGNPNLPNNKHLQPGFACTTIIEFNSLSALERAHDGFCQHLHGAAVAQATTIYCGKLEVIWGEFWLFTHETNPKGSGKDYCMVDESISKILNSKCTTTKSIMRILP